MVPNKFFTSLKTRGIKRKLTQQEKNGRLPPILLLHFYVHIFNLDLYITQVHAGLGWDPVLHTVPGLRLYAGEPPLADHQRPGGVRPTGATDHEGTLRHRRGVRQHQK